VLRDSELLIPQTAENLRVIKNIRDLLVHDPDNLEKTLFFQACDSLLETSAAFVSNIQTRGFCTLCKRVTSDVDEPETKIIDYCNNEACRSPYIIVSNKPLRYLSLVKNENGEYVPTEEEFVGSFDLSRVDETIKIRKQEYGEEW